MENTIDESTINKINALLNLTNMNGATEHEAANASAHVMRLLAKYNLDMAEFDKISNPVEEITRDFQSNNKSMPTWKTNLISCIAKAHFCSIYLSTGRRSTSHVIVGKPTNIQAVKILYSFLLDVIESDSQMALKSYKGWEHGKRYSNSFKIGMVARISERFKSEMKQIQQDHVKALGEANSSTTSIVVKNIYDEAQKEIQAFYQSIGLRLNRSSYSGTIGSGSGFSSGYQAGANVPLHSSPSLKQRN
jgi:hypothetical protein